MGYTWYIYQLLVISYYIYISIIYIYIYIYINYIYYIYIYQLLVEKKALESFC